MALTPKKGKQGPTALFQGATSATQDLDQSLQENARKNLKTSP